ncbi:MAG TPA: radical SAM family heme chaperone HemW [Candidatus Paceibacterota bacterium]
MNYNELFDRANAIQKNKLLGLNKDFKEYAFTFVYPPPQCLYQINEETLVRKNEINSANIYIHIPYCTGKCKYCYFCCYDMKNVEIKKAEYIDLLCKEISLAREKLGTLNITSIHIGGGTPTTLTENEFNKLFSSLHSNFIIENGLEITCESSPETLNEKKLKHLLSLGVNRLNIGVQSFDDNILFEIARRHDGNQAKRAIALAQDVGLTNINIDLIYGLPNQTIQNWVETLQQAIDLKVQSISTYRLRQHPKSKLHDVANLSEESGMIDRYIKLLEIMEKSKYIQASSHKFAFQEEFLQKQILSKRGVKNNELLSFGLSSYGYLGNVLYWNERQIEDYKNSISNNCLSCSLGYELNLEEQKSKICVLGLHNYKGINMTDYENRFGSSILFDFDKQIKELLSQELAQVINNHFCLTQLGMIFADEIALLFYSENIKNELSKKSLRYGMFFDEIV